MVGAGFQTYRRTDVITADPKKLVIMCYEGAIHSLKTARAKYVAEEYEAKAKAIQNALDILNELRTALDFDRGGEIARNLESLYSFWITHIMKADQNRDLRGLDQAAAMLEEIKTALEEAYYGQQEGETLPLPLGEPVSRSPRENRPFRAPGF